MLRTFNIYSFAFVIAITVLVSGANAQQPNVDEDGLPVANEQDKNPTGEDSLDLQLLDMIGDLQDRQDVLEKILDGGVTPAEQQDFTEEILAINARITKIEELLENLPEDHEGRDIDLGPYKKAIKKLRATDEVHTEAIEGLVVSYGNLHSSLTILGDIIGDHELRITDLEEAGSGQDAIITANIERSTQNELDIAAMMTNRENGADAYGRGRFLGVAADAGMFLGLFGVGVNLPLEDWVSLSFSFEIGQLHGREESPEPVVGGAGTLAFAVYQNPGNAFSSVDLGIDMTVAEIMTEAFVYKSNTYLQPTGVVRLMFLEDTLGISAYVGGAITIDEAAESKGAFTGGLAVEVFAF